MDTVGPADAQPEPARGDDVVDFASGAASRVPPAAPKPRGQRRRVGRIVFWVSFAVVTACLAGSIAGLRETSRLFANDSSSMENTIQPGDRLLVATGPDIRRGDVVIISDPQGPGTSPGSYVKRLIGLPGDHVACCDAAGDITVNGRELHEEAYRYPGDGASPQSFSVTLGTGQAWVMGDHRSISLDSREWGPVPEANIVGWVFGILRGTSWIQLTTPGTFAEDGLAPSSGRTPVALAYFGGAALATPALLALGVLGIARWAIRRSRAGRARRAASHPP